MQLSTEQQYALELFKDRKNIFISGPGGTGKSALINNIYDYTNKYRNIKICAMTGFAATQINNQATTLHSWAGIGIGNGDIDNLLKKIRRLSNKKDNWLSADILIVDEVSQMSKRLFDILNKIGQSIRKNKLPFGGIQLVFVGDFYQLPPIGNENDIDSSKYCFESEEWFNIFPIQNSIILQQIFRQSDKQFCKILNQIREGKISKKSLEILKSYINRQNEDNNLIIPTKLFPTRRQVDSINELELNKINDESMCYEMIYILDNQMEKEECMKSLNYLCKNIPVPQKIYLKKGSQVMNIINMETGRGNKLVNGSRGIIIGFQTETRYPIVKFNEGFEETIKPYNWVHDTNQNMAVSQLPIILAWALTIHKSQGSTLDTAEMNIGNDIFEVGQTYVALSRVKTLNGLYLNAFDPSKIKINKKVIDFYSKFKVSFS